MSPDPTANTTPTSPPPPAAAPSPPTPPGSAAGATSGPGLPTPVATGGTTGPAGGAGASTPAAAPVSSGLAAAQSPASQALAGQQQTPPAQAPDFDTAFRERFGGMTPAQVQYLTQLGYQSWQQSRQQPQPPQPAGQQPPKSVFGLPEFDHRLLNFISRDPTGRLVATAGAPPDALARYEAFSEQLTEVQRKFWSDPMQYLGSAIDERASKIAQQLVQQHLGGFREQQQVQTLLASNADWLYERDANGQTRHTFDPMTGQSRPVLSAAGQAYQRFVKEAADSGIRTSEGQHKYAVALLQNQLMHARLQQQGAVQQGQQAAQQFLQQQAASPPPPAPNVAPPAQHPKTLREVMRERFHQNGVTDQVLQSQMNGAA